MMVTEQRRKRRKRTGPAVKAMIGGVRLEWGADCPLHLTESSRLQAVAFEEKDNTRVFLQKQLGRSDWHFLANHPGLIPKELWGKQVAIICPGTVWVSAQGDWWAPGLWQPAGRWIRSRVQIRQAPNAQRRLFETTILQSGVKLFVLQVVE